MYCVSKKFKFEAAHSLPHLPEGHKCRNLHGHSYVFEVCCCKYMLDDNDFVIDYADLSKVVQPIVDKLDHQNLNEILPFKTTAENLARYIFEQATHNMRNTWIKEVKLFETASTCVSYTDK